MRGLAVVAFACLLTGGCLFGETSTGALDEAGSVPVRGEWEVVLDASMALEGPAAISRLRVGGLEYEGNFANRGDIVIDTWNEPRIRVQMRPFTRSLDNVVAREELDRFELWAFATEGAAPQRAEDMLVPRPCVNEDGSLRDLCAMRVLYEGQLQPSRAGADLWVTLPEQWDGFLEVYTEDNDHDGDYLNRGNVCVDGLRAELSVDLESGLAFARLAEGADANVRGDAANVTIEVPSNITSRLSSAVVSAPNEDLFCSASFDVDNFIFAPSEDGDRQRGTAGPQPHAATPALAASVTNNACHEQINVESPEAYVDPDEVGELQLHGNIRFCHDCLAAPCAQLLPGFE